MVVTRTVNGKPIRVEDLNSLNLTNPTLNQLFSTVVKRVERVESERSASAQKDPQFIG
jgi:hypothetical protein